MPLAALAQATPGVTAHEIVVGTLQDLSGPVAAYGKAALQGMQIRIDEANELGGIHGRKIRLLNEDSGYDAAKSLKGAQKLVLEDKIFAMIGTTGLPPVVASLPVVVDNGVIHFLPLAPGKMTYEPLHRLKFAWAPTYYDQVRIAAGKIIKDRNLQKPCVVYQDDAFGAEILQGLDEAVKTTGKALVEKLPYKRGATDFSGHAASVKASGCDMLVLGAALRETVAVMTEVKKAGANPMFLATSGAYSDALVKMGGKAVDGLFATNTVQHPYADSPSAKIARWAALYRTKYNVEPSTHSAYAYAVMDIFMRALQSAGHNLSTDSFIKAMETTRFGPDPFGGPELSFRADKRLGNPYSRLSQLVNGRWSVVSDYIAFNGLKTVMDKNGQFRTVSEHFKD